MFKSIYSVFVIFVLCSYFLFFRVSKTVSAACCSCDTTTDRYGNCNVSDTINCHYLCPPTCPPNNVPQSSTMYATSGTFYIYAYGVTNATMVNFKVWSQVNGQDDVHTYDSTDMGSGTWRATIDLANHPGVGLINVEITMDNTTYTNQTCGTANFTRLTPPPWIKLKDTSIYSRNSLISFVPQIPVAYDTDDDGSTNLIVGIAGVVGAPTINITDLYPEAKIGNPEYKIVYSPESFFLTPSTYLSYVKARKEYITITNPDLSEIIDSGIYIYNEDLIIDSDSEPFNQSSAYNIVLVSTGTVTINPASDNTFSPKGSIAIVAPNIVFNTAITQADGLFIANSVDTGTTVNQGLKIIGNLVAQATLINNRNLSDLNKPVIFVKFDQTKYIDLLPYLSTATYDWRQIQ